MFEDDFGYDLEVDECEISSLSSISKKYTTIIFFRKEKNKKCKCIDFNSVSPIKGAKNIKNLVINKNSMLTDMSITQLFPVLETVDVYGASMKTMDGIENSFQGWYVKIDTGRNSSRDISMIANTKISKLIIKYGNTYDVEAIARSETIKNLELLDFPEIDFSVWKHVPIEMMKISGGALSIVKDTNFVKSLKKLFIIKCRKVEKFSGNNSNVSWVIVDTCNNFDMASIASLVNAEFVNIVNRKTSFPCHCLQG